MDWGLAEVVAPGRYGMTGETAGGAGVSPAGEADDQTQAGRPPSPAVRVGLL